MKSGTCLWVTLVLVSHLALAETDQTAAPIGKFFDPDNLQNIGNVQSGAQATHDAMKQKDLYAQGKYKDMLQEAFSKYQNSKVGLMNLLSKIQKKVSAVLEKASERVDKWRTTVPKIKSYAAQTERYMDDSYDFAKTFELSDLWDIDRNFSKEMEWRLSQGRRLGLSIWDWLGSRIERKGFLQGIESILFPDYIGQLNRSAVGGFVYDDAPSNSERIPIFVLHESLNVLNTVQEMAEAEIAPSEEAPGLSRQQFVNRRLREALFDPRSGYVDQVSLRQDILNRQYEIAVRRSVLKDKTAELDLLWGKLAAQKLENKEATTKAIADEVKQLSGVELNPEAWIYSRFGLEDAP